MKVKDKLLIQKLKPMMDEADGKVGLVMLINGELEDDEPYWAFIVVKPSKLVEFREVMDAGRMVTLTDYGEILRAGAGEFPSEDVMKEMEETYNVDYQFAEKVRKGIAEADI